MPRSPSLSPHTPQLPPALPRTAGDPPPGTVLAGDFRIDTRLGAGGMGVVYRGWQFSKDRPVAVKLLGSAVPSGSQLERFAREARAIAGLQHPGIVELYHVGQDCGVGFLAMELVDGPSVREWLAIAVEAPIVQRSPESFTFWGEGAELPPAPPPVRFDRLHTPAHARAAAEIVRDTARAVAAAHRQGVLHRDIKPDNVMLAADGTVKVIDFGLARAYADATLTATGQLIGTPLYMAPEQLTGRPAGPAADVYALGAMLYELLVGQPPAAAVSYEAVVRSVLYRPPVPADRANPAVDRRLAAAVHAAMARDPADRYPTADALAEDLARWLAGGPVSVGGYRYRYDGREVLAERPALVTAAGYVCLFVAGFHLFAAAVLPRVATAVGFAASGLVFLGVGLGLLGGRRWGPPVGVVWAAACVLFGASGIGRPAGPGWVYATAAGIGLGGLWVLGRRRVRDWFRFAAARRAEFRATTGR